MDENDKTQRLCEIAGRFYELPQHNFLASSTAPFDISKPNIHDTKAEFLDEVAYITRVLGLIDGLTEQLEKAFRKDDDMHITAAIVTRHADRTALRRQSKKKIEFPHHVAMKSAAEVGLSLITALTLLELKDGFLERQQELENQRAVFWNTTGRAPNHYARTIALRFAK